VEEAALCQWWQLATLGIDGSNKLVHTAKIRKSEKIKR
jgi:hypothetical protein